MAIIRKIVRAAPDDIGEKTLKAAVIQMVGATVAEDEMPILDAGFPLREVQGGLEHYLVRLRSNFAGRRNRLPEYKGGRPPEYGDFVRPLARIYNDHVIEATPPDRVTTWTEKGVQIRAEFWNEVVRRDVKVHPDNDTFTVVAIHDPRFTTPLLLACPVELSIHRACSEPLSGKALYGLYRNRSRHFSTHRRLFWHQMDWCRPSRLPVCIVAILRCIQVSGN
ncbi:MAG: hypothetical protein U9Q78_06470 [Chloroflexota bacterium]|nr:hypothetical protein [Chloroflexota bacterium]